MVLPSQTGPLPFELAYLKLPPQELPDRYRYPVGAPVLDKIAMECAWAVESGLRGRPTPGRWWDL